MAPSKRGKRAALPVESSWRMVEGSENDSFDTSIVQDPFEDDLIISSGPSQFSASSQDFSIGSQDSIRDFTNRADEDQIIMRAPFRPSLATTRHTSMDSDRTPVPEFFMPTVEVDSPQRSSRSSRTTRPSEEDREGLRRRGTRQEPGVGSPRKGQTSRSDKRRPYGGGLPSDRPQTPWDRFHDSLPSFVLESLSWCGSVLGLALRWSKWPLAMLIAIYLTIGAGMMARNLITQSITTSLSPLCRIPGASMLDLPFCPDLPPAPGSPLGTKQVEFDELMNVQAQFEKVLEDSAQGVSLPMEMKRSEASVRDLRTMVKFSDLPARDELVYELDNYVDTVRTISGDLQTFNTHVGSAVDSVISINRWTSRYIDSIAVSREAKSGLVSHWSSWVFSPFQPVIFDERMILDKYIEHTAMVSDKIGGLIVEAQATLRLLAQAENNLELINEHVVRSDKTVKEKHNEVFWDLWTLVGANNRRLHNLKAQITLLRAVGAQRVLAVNQLVGLVHDLNDIQTKLGDLRDRVAAPELVADTSTIPLSVHIDTINAGVERLEAARSRIRAEENDRLQQALSRARDDERLIEG